jgi:hypothetical protein
MSATKNAILEVARAIRVVADRVGTFATGTESVAERIQTLHENAYIDDPAVYDTTMDILGNIADAAPAS